MNEYLIHLKPLLRNKAAVFSFLNESRKTDRK